MRRVEAVFEERRQKLEEITLELAEEFEMLNKGCDSNAGHQP